MLRDLDLLQRDGRATVPLSRRPAASRAARLVVRAEGEAKPIHLTSTAFKAVKDIDEIMKILPHRFPFLLVDRVIDFEQGAIPSTLQSQQTCADVPLAAQASTPWPSRM